MLFVSHATCFATCSPKPLQLFHLRVPELSLSSNRNIIYHHISFHVLGCGHYKQLTEVSAGLDANGIELNPPWPKAWEVLEFWVDWSGFGETYRTFIGL